MEEATAPPFRLFWAALEGAPTCRVRPPRERQSGSEMQQQCAPYRDVRAQRLVFESFCSFWCVFSSRKYTVTVEALYCWVFLIQGNCAHNKQHSISGYVPVLLHKELFSGGTKPWCICAQHCHVSHVSASSSFLFLNVFVDLRERETSISCSSTPRMQPNQDWPCNLGLCPDRKSHPRPFSAWADTPASWATLPRVSPLNGGRIFYQSNIS